EGAGDLETGPHHTAEDAVLALGEALDRALGERRGIAHYGNAVVPMDDALARAAVDLGGRPWAEIELSPDPGMATHMLGSLAQAGRLAMNALTESGLSDALQARRGRTLGICLGLQLALEESEEDGGVPGLGLVPGRAVRLDRERVPRIGWAPLEPSGTAYYFAHSYAAVTPAAG